MPNNKKKINNIPLSTRIEEEFLQYIKDNNLKIGDKLPNEATLSKTFSVGRSSLREVTSRLVSRGVLEVRQGSGTFILDPIPSDKDPLGLRFEKNDKKISNDLFQILLEIEPFIFSLAARNASSEDIKLITKASKNENNPIEFHSSIAKASKNCLSENLTKLLYSTTELFKNRIFEVDNNKEYKKCKNEILNNIKDHNELGARLACQALLYSMYTLSLEQ